jgi:hypothetical protein
MKSTDGSATKLQPVEQLGDRALIVFAAVAAAIGAYRVGNHSLSATGPPALRTLLFDGLPAATLALMKLLSSTLKTVRGFRWVLPLLGVVTLAVLRSVAYVGLLLASRRTVATMLIWLLLLTSGGAAGVFVAKIHQTTEERAASAHVARELLAHVIENGAACTSTGSDLLRTSLAALNEATPEGQRSPAHCLLTGLKEICERNPVPLADILDSVSPIMEQNCRTLQQYEDSLDLTSDRNLDSLAALTLAAASASFAAGQEGKDPVHIRKAAVYSYGLKDLYRRARREPPDNVSDLIANALGNYYATCFEHSDRMRCNEQTIDYLRCSSERDCLDEAQNQYSRMQSHLAAIEIRRWNNQIDLSRQLIVQAQASGTDRSPYLLVLNNQKYSAPRKWLDDAINLLTHEAQHTGVRGEVLITVAQLQSVAFWLDWSDNGHAATAPPQGILSALSALEAAKWANDLDASYLRDDFKGKGWCGIFLAASSNSVVRERLSLLLDAAASGIVDEVNTKARDCGMKTAPAPEAHAGLP